MNVDQGKCIAALYMDLRKAFEAANHTCIIKKLPDFGKRNTELDWLAEWYPITRAKMVQVVPL